MNGAVPSGEAAWFRLVYDNQPRWWALLAEACGGEVRSEPGGVQATIVPDCPERSFFNSVHYSDTEAMAASLPRLADAYAEAGINAWTVWAPASDREAAAALAEAGHVLDAEPRAMALDMAELRPRRPDTALEIREDADLKLLRSLNEIAYGYPEGQFPAMSLAWSDAHVYLADADGETVSTVMAWDHAGDTEITFVSTLPEVRGRGFATAITSHALERAAERGQATATLVATKLGFPAYAGLGFRDTGGLEMWERRRS